MVVLFVTNHIMVTYQTYNGNNIEISQYLKMLGLHLVKHIEFSDSLARRSRYLMTSCESHIFTHIYIARYSMKITIGYQGLQNTKATNH